MQIQGVVCTEPNSKQAAPQPLRGAMHCASLAVPRRSLCVPAPVVPRLLSALVAGWAVRPGFSKFSGGGLAPVLAEGSAALCPWRRGAELSRCSNNAGRLERSLPKRRAHGHGRARAREHGSWRRGGRRAGGTARPALARGKGREGNPTRRRRGRHRQASRQATQTRAHRVLHQNGCLGTRSPVPPACVPH
jgi:hypothetical protein